MQRKKLVALGALATLVALVVGLLVATGPTQAAGSRTIYLSAVEYKGGANVADEPYPPAEEPGTLPLDPVGGEFGYRLKPPDATGRWEVSSYRFEPGFFTARVGEQITLEIAGINGAYHEVRLIRPSGTWKTFVVTRGRLTRVGFRPAKAGIYRLVCLSHAPGMQAEILVLSS